MAKPTQREIELSEQLARATAQLGNITGERERIRGELSEARTEIKLLREKIDALVRRLFGAQSEKLDPAQLLLMLQGLEAPGKSPETGAAEAPRRSTAPSPPRSNHGPRWPADLQGRRGGHRSGAREGVPRGMALHRRGSHRAARLRTGAHIQTPHRAAKICVARSSLRRADPCAAGHAGGTFHRRTRPARRSHHRKILRPPAALPAGATERSTTLTERSEQQNRGATHVLRWCDDIADRSRFIRPLSIGAHRTASLHTGFNHSPIYFAHCRIGKEVGESAMTQGVAAQRGALRNSQSRWVGGERNELS